METQIAMAGKPYRSCLIPYEVEILSLRHRRPPTPYSQISEFLFQKHQLNVRRETIFKFIKVRSRGHKAFIYGKAAGVDKPHASEPPAITVKTAPSQPKPIFDFPYSERYNLHRLDPQEAAARRKKLEAERH